MSIKLNFFICLIFIIFLTARTFGSESHFENSYDDSLIIENRILNLNFNSYLEFKNSPQPNHVKSNELFKTYKKLESKIATLEKKINVFANKKFDKGVTKEILVRQGQQTDKLKRLLENQKVEIENIYLKEMNELERKLSLMDIYDELTSIQLPQDCLFQQTELNASEGMIGSIINKGTSSKQLIIHKDRIVKAISKVIHKDATIENSYDQTEIFFYNDENEVEKIIWKKDRSGKIDDFVYRQEKSQKYLIDFNGIRLYDLVEPEQEFHCSIYKF